MSRKTPTTRKKDAEAEVEDLLKAVEDDMLLNLSLNSHMSRVSPNYLDSDLDSRLRALKSPSSSSPSPNLPSSTTSAVVPPPQRSTPEHPADPELADVLGDDLATRFAALKASLPSSQSPARSVAAKTSEVSDRDEEERADEDDEVERLIRWAKDAARLDPSPPSDDDDDDDVDDDNDDDGDRRHKK